MRLRANASRASIRGLSRSKKRLQVLKKVDTTKLTKEELTRHQEKVAKHKEAVERCKEEDRTSFSITNEFASLMKFPHGGAEPGHRIQAVGAGMKERIVVGVLVNSSPTDADQLEGVVRDARDRLLAAGLPKKTKLQMAGDGGYNSKKDLAFAEANRDWVDLLISLQSTAQRKTVDKKEPLFGSEQFAINEDGSATCPAGRQMKGPLKEGRGRLKWLGVRCDTCKLRALCTEAKQRKLTCDPESLRLWSSMRERMSRPGARERYNRRIATIEPVFSGIEDMMAFRRASSRLTHTVLAEVLLKMLAYNITRLAALGRLVVASCEVGMTKDGPRLFGLWIRRDALTRVKSPAGPADNVR